MGSATPRSTWLSQALWLFPARRPEDFGLVGPPASAKLPPGCPVPPVLHCNYVYLRKLGCVQIAHLAAAISGISGNLSVLQEGCETVRFFPPAIPAAG